MAWIRTRVLNACAVYNVSNTKWLSFLHSCTVLGPSHQLTNPHGCEIQQVAGGVSRDAGDAQVSEVDGPHLVLVVVQDAETAGAVGGIGALKGQERFRGAERKRNTRGLWSWILQFQPQLSSQT